MLILAPTTLPIFNLRSLFFIFPQPTPYQNTKFVYTILHIVDKCVENTPYLGISAYLYTLVYTNKNHQNNHFLAILSEINKLLFKPLTLCSKNAILSLLIFENVRFSLPGKRNLLHRLDYSPFRFAGINTNTKNKYGLNMALPIQHPLSGQIRYIF